MAKKVSKMVRILLKIAYKPNLTQPNLGFLPGSQLIFEFLKLHLSILAKSLQNLAWTIKNFKKWPNLTVRFIRNDPEISCFS